MPDPPAVLGVVNLSPAFSEVWATLATSAGAGVKVAPSLAGLGDRSHLCGVLIGAGGAEVRALDVLAGRDSPVSAGVAVVGADGDYRLVASLLKAGAGDYFCLPADLGALRTWMVERVEGFRAACSRECRTNGTGPDFSSLIGEHPSFRAVLDRTARVLRSPSATVLVLGETGTGKQLVAEAIHRNGPRAAGPFVEINCSAVPAHLLESELFGYEKGAFTDARFAKPGLFETANGGTLFLDEIGDLAPELQAKLLKVLETWRVRRLGSVKEVELDVRIVAATHVDLAACVHAGTFRRDLYYRLAVVPVELPPLRERGGDLLLLARHFAGRFAAEMEHPEPRLSPPVIRAIEVHRWPGNVRELRNAIERAVLLGEGAIHAEDLFFANACAEGPSGSGPLPFPASLREIEAAAARAMLAQHQGNKSRAARALGISRRHLYVLLGAQPAEVES